MTTLLPRPFDRATAEPPTEVLTSLTQEIQLRRSMQLRHAPSAGRRRDVAAIGVALAAAVLSIAACVHFYLEQRILGYHDTFAHLEISRRLLNGRTTGIAQLGAIWLPVPHILQSMLAWSRPLYITGLAGSIVSMTAFVVCTTLIYRTVRVFSPQRVWPAIAAAAVFMTNPNVLYHQTTPMDELTFYACAMGAVYGLVRWADTMRATYLLRASIACMLAMLCRYEGWFLGGVLTVAVLIMARQTGHSWRDTRGLTSIFAVFGVAVPAIGWLAYNWAVTGSPVNFYNGPHSSVDQMSRRTIDVAVGSWTKTLHAYGSALVADFGVIVLTAAAVGLLVFLVVGRLSARTLPILGLSAILPFYVFTIYRGGAPISVPPVTEPLLNLRFALVAGLPAAVFIGFLLARLPRRTVLATSVLTVLGLLSISAIAFKQDSLVTVREAAQHQAAQEAQAEVAEFLDGRTAGPILLNIVGNERAAFPVLDRVIYEGTKINKVNVWEQALRSPQSVGAHVVLVRHSRRYGPDELHGALHKKPVMAAYRVVFKNTDYTVYQLRT